MFDNSAVTSWDSCSINLWMTKLTWYLPTVVQLTACRKKNTPFVFRRNQHKFPLIRDNSGDYVSESSHNNLLETICIGIYNENRVFDWSVHAVHAWIWLKIVNQREIFHWNFFEVNVKLSINELDSRWHSSDSTIKPQHVRLVFNVSIQSKLDDSTDFNFTLYQRNSSWAIDSQKSLLSRAQLSEQSEEQSNKREIEIHAASRVSIKVSELFAQWNGLGRTQSFD